MKGYYSRLEINEERKYLRKAILFGVLTALTIFLFLVFGLPTATKFASILTEIGKSQKPTEKEDLTPPPPPRLESLPHVTNNKEVDIKGYTETGAQILLSVNGESIELISNKDGEFIYTLRLIEGENTISAKARDSGGNESQDSQIVKVIYDKIPPNLEISSPKDGSEFYSSRGRLVEIKGTTEKGSTLTVNDRLIVLSEDGTFDYATSLSEGENKFVVKAKDEAANETEKTLTIKFYP